MAAKDAMTAARKALVAHGFVEDGDTYTQSRRGVERTRYEAVDGGFKRYFRGEAMVHSLLPKDDAVFKGLPPGVRNGIDSTEYPQYFQWVWPAEDIAKIYG